MNKKIRIAVLVSGNGTNLQALINAQKNKVIKNGKIELVISNNSNAFALKRAKKSKIPFEIISKKECKKIEEFEKKLKEILKSYKIELIVLAGFMSVLSKNFVKDYPKKIINIHPSLIPSFCGKNFYGIKVHEEAIKRGVKITGATTHFVNEIVDGGEIIMQKAVKVLDNDTAEKLQKRVMESAEWIILPKTVEKVCKSLIL
ncbi:phosphoribosylglycinamide formyltransferase [Brachyspira aalborgi]|jgi:phosphoribosylglycinamide formyltransferase-1|uniref:Phosphoribosylglycinamide formyltransferase n=1 Tax=Brachyspira aalborgi TaxID=29522 RepID=A0AB38PYA9_9SPIR|nr:phosphoribosylglycinamide formyltransferase [Brachyspira aalborgi]MBS4762639.1 phosphoribosylglycinamide formyltransferase [Brachyspira sp.]CCY78212.1 phosphoribosylglycinamide formyltransferase [Brachyspira sp. CAG:700]TXJ15059.1 phosphoribosylglycinamide formyltransferase [Brachyspira aalborgi]TXJ18305.1 phosphoribosylglycinamide formyltransferase [Brachyspira aalborgi]TXJ24263.1 phosphoribosylglycinamide formyltransferase [Brachyspira aalborgi]